ncbi:AAA family ATPase [Paraburkholderia caribensis]|uniref:AAA family ATPase n=1 Tax=Paraburkholderia caribensis TaxID=75105 RepID=A0A9Q6WQU4_9BURK|nr:AAA family ATPase [Paraburkholderia caribensis]MCO4876394.1 AAA family ATPase [Paraburkholderia caribensis]PTB26985.1 ATP-binding protein [Paraburkholderia caribensis]QLB67563.1 ATP-binding protein [Paraburkholderia caribensis]
MLNTLAINNYRSIRELVIPLTRLNLITGPNGSGKSNIYRALRLLASTAQDGIIAPLAREGGLNSVVWAGPEDRSGRMRRGEIPVQHRAKGTPASRLKLGFAGEEFGYAVSMGLVTPAGNEDRDTPSSFALDPEFKRESIWAGPVLRPASLLVDRDGSVVRRRLDQGWDVLTHQLPRYESLFSEVGRDKLSPEVFSVREAIRGWRFYDHFRVDADSLARQQQIGTRTLVLDHDGRDLAAAWQTIREIGDREALDEAVNDAFPGAWVEIESQPGGFFYLRFHQEGLLRPLGAAELSDGTLRYLLLCAALLTPRPPELMVLNEPEASLHPDLTMALGRLIRRAARNSQLWVVSHSTRLAAALEEDEDCNPIILEKVFSETTIPGQHLPDRPAWSWADGKK